MRAIAQLTGTLLVVLAVPVAAEPPPQKPVRLGDIVKEAVTATARDRERVDSVLNMDGTRSSAIVVKPPDHPDGALASRGGSWIIPPDPNDPMAIELGTNQLGARARVDPWLPRDLSRQLKRGADKVWDFVLPKL